ncbi:MAG: DUF4402 domain-containing protein [Gammaproteobacteria bacterium]|nr:DUF4402 domain-containing protein [Gammaproteobacteria bacterium]
MSQGWCKNNTVLTPATNLTFGTFASYSGGTVTVSVEGLRSTDGSGGVVLMGGTVTQAVYTIRGCANDTYSIVTPADTVLTDGVGNSMPMINFVSFPVGSGILDANGDGTLQFGATLTVANPQPSGNYSGTYLVEIVLQ